MYFAPPRLVDDLNAELGCHRVDIGNAEVNEGVGSSITAVLREEQAGCSIACERDERWKRRLKVVFPFLHKAQALVPRRGTPSIAHAQNRNRLVRHRARLPDPA